MGGGGVRGHHSEPPTGPARLAIRDSSDSRPNQISSVSQDDSLYAGTLAENIAFFDPEIDMRG